MNFTELVIKTRSCRVFEESRELSRDVLLHLVDLARLSASARNMQPLKYMASCRRDINEIIFPFLAWAGYLESWDGPEAGERPSGYILVFLDHRIAGTPVCDHGIAAQTILLGAAEQGIAGCMIGSVKKKSLTDALGIPDHLELLMVVALGYPAEEIVIEQVHADGNIRYWRDEYGVHHVPKRSLESILVHPVQEEEM